MFRLPYVNYFDQRGFKVAKGYEDKEINLPKRQTIHAAGYDFESAEDVQIPSIWGNFINALIYMNKYDSILSGFREELFKPTMVKTGVKAYMQEDEGLFLFNRSGNFKKKGLLLTNGVGVIDQDYYENQENDGDIMFQFINLGIKTAIIKKGERIGQGVFQQFLKTDDDEPVERIREGGHGHTSEEEQK